MNDILKGLIEHWHNSNELVLNSTFRPVGLPQLVHNHKFRGCELAEEDPQALCYYVDAQLTVTVYVDKSNLNHFQTNQHT